MIIPAKPIICYHCNKQSGYTKGHLWMVIPPKGLCCKNCGKVVIANIKGMLNKTKELFKKLFVKHEDVNDKHHNHDMRDWCYKCGGCCQECCPCCNEENDATN